MRAHLLRHAARGAITVLAALVLYVVVLLGFVAWAGLREAADHTLIEHLVAAAAYDASLRSADGELVAGSAALSCLDPSCAPQACSRALARDPGGRTAPGQACHVLDQGLARAYPGPDARVDVAATLATTRVWVLTPGAHDPDEPARVYHFPTICLATDVTVGIMAHDGLGLRQHVHACAQTVYR